MSWKEAFFGHIPVAVAKSLREDAGSWTSDTERMGSPYQLTHSSGVIVWVANCTFGMEVFADEHRLRKAWGGVSALSVFGLSPGHHFLRHAANRWLREHDVGGARVRVASLLATSQPSR